MSLWFLWVVGVMIERMFDRLCLGDVPGDVPGDLERIAPGVELGSVLAGLDLDRLSDHDLVRVMQAQDRQISHYQGLRAWSIDEITRRYQHGVSEGSVRFYDAADGAAAEIGAALCLARRTAESVTGFSVTLVRRRRPVFDALLLGGIDVGRARVLVDGTLCVSDVTADAVIAELLAEAPGLTAAQLRARVRKLVIDADPEVARRRYELSIDDRRVVVHANDSGTATLLLTDVAPHDAVSIRRYAHREAIKFKNLGDSRTMDQLRTDICIDLLKRRHRGKKITRADFGNLTVTGTAETFAKLSDESAELAGFGPLLADIACQVADHQQHAERRWALIDPDTKQPIDGGITRRKPTTAQRRRTEIMYPTCIHVGCRMPSVDCDIDHQKLYSETPVTCTCELGPMCRHHHVIRHKYGWTYKLVDGGDFLFTSPFGHQYHTSGRPVPVARSP